MFRYNLIFQNIENGEVANSVELGEIEYTHILQKNDVVVIPAALLKKINSKFHMVVSRKFWVAEIIHFLPDRVPSLFLVSVPLDDLNGL